MPPRDSHFIDRQALNNATTGGLPQTSLQALPGHIPPNANISRGIRIPQQPQEQTEGYYGSGWRSRRKNRYRRPSNRWRFLPWYNPWYTNVVKEPEEEEDDFMMSDFLYTPVGLLFLLNLVLLFILILFLYYRK